MGTNELLKDAIIGVIKENGNNEITGNVLQNVLISIVNTIGETAGFAGIATPASNPGYRDDNVIYLAATPGVYSNFNGVSLSNGEIAIIANSTGSWKKHSLGNLQSNYIDIEYGDIVRLRDMSGLIPGGFYRITDYITTTTQENTQSAGHPFDVIVMALSGSELSEEAWAIQSARDTDGYFSNSALSGWKIWYSLDNDVERFAWADTENGKGVIYRMIDEWGNDCPYDFKNILFTHPNDQAYADFYYTFNSFNENEIIDYSLNGKLCYKNTMGAYFSQGLMLLNCNVFILYNNASFHNNNYGDNCHHNSAKNSCYNNTFGNGCYSIILNKGVADTVVISSCNKNIFEQECYDITLGSNCSQNIFSVGCHVIQLEQNCGSNSFGTNCRGITLAANCLRNVFKNECYNITVGYGNENNSFGLGCYVITVAGDCYDNNFGADCHDIEMGEKSHTNDIGVRSQKINLGRSCFSNTFKTRCNNIQLGDRCYANYFGIACRGISFRVSATPNDTLRAYCYMCHFDDGVEYVNLFNAETASAENGIVRYSVSSATYGTSSRPLAVYVSNLNNNYQTIVARDSLGLVKQFCIADLIQ